MTKLRTILVVALALSPGFGWTSPTWAAYPQPADPFVNDFAHILTPTEEADLAAPLRRVRQSLGVQATVVTVPSYRSYGTGDDGIETIESFATALFNTWGVGHWARDDGVLIVLAVQDREVRIELGEGYGRVHDLRMERIVQERMVPRFRSGDLAGGLIAAADALEDVLPQMRPLEDVRSPVGSPPAGSSQAGAPTVPSSPRPRTEPPRSTRPRSRPSPQPVRTTYRSSRSGRRASSELPWVWLLGLLAFLGIGARFYLRYRSRRCPECQGPMKRLDEREDDEYLDAGQRREESLRSVDYDVWQCETCGAHGVWRYWKWLSRFEACPECAYRTAQRTRRVLVYATYDRAGEEEITRHCAHCNWNQVTRARIPRLERDDNTSHLFSDGGRHSGGGRSSSGSISRSSGGTFGGGRSGGGGASGKW